MVRTPWDVVLQHVRALAAPRRQGEDAELLRRFVAGRDEAAFEALLRRHGPMVLRVARRVLRSEPDAEDVFQATFLLLARKAGSIRRRDAVAGWLHGVARRLALHAQADRARRRAKESRAARSRTDTAWSELDGVLDDVLAQLPEKYRTPLVCCYLEGRTQEEVAHLLGAPLGTVRSWLARGRDLLRRRLLRRSVTLSAAGVSTALLAVAAAATASAVPAPLLRATRSAAPLFAGGKSTADTISVQAASLAREGMTSMAMANLKRKAAGVLVLALFAAGTGLLARQGHETQPAEAVSQAPREGVPAGAGGEGKGAKGPTDRHGDPLPPGAVARLGTVRFRHESGIERFAVSPDGRAIAAVTQWDFACWDATTGQPLRRLTSAQALQCLAFAPDGKSVAVGGRDFVVRLLDPASGKELRRFVEHGMKGAEPIRGVFGVAFTPDGQTLLSWASDGYVRLWEVQSGKERRRIREDDWANHGLFVHGLSPDGKTLSVEGGGGIPSQEIQLWDIPAGKEARRLTHPAAVRAVAFSADGKSLAVAFGEHGQAGKVLLWDLPEGKEIGTLAGHESPILGLAFSPDGKALASGGEDKTVRLWDLVSRKEVHKPLRLRRPVFQLAFSPDGKTLLTSERDCQVRLWDVAAWRERVPAEGPEDGIASLTYSPDGKLVAAACGGRVWLWEAATGKVVRTLEGDPDSRLAAVAFSADGKLLVAGNYDGTVLVWDPGTWDERRRLPGAGSRAELFALSPDGVTVAAWGIAAQHTVALWDSGTGKERGTLAAPAETPGGRTVLRALCFSRDGKTLYAASATHRSVLRWNVAEGKALPALGRHDEGLAALALSADERSTAVVTMGGALHVWDLATGELRLTVKDVGYQPSIAFSPDGRWLALANAVRHRPPNGEGVGKGEVEKGEEVRLLRIADAKVVRRLAGHAGGISCLSFSPDGRRLASGGHDTTILIWDMTGLGEPGPGDAPRPEPEAPRHER
jgi:RNA polymerase sigma factor (sigma-70 family)